MDNKKTFSTVLVLGGFIVFFKYVAKFFEATDDAVKLNCGIVMGCSLVLATIGIISLRNINSKSKNNQ